MNNQNVQTEIDIIKFFKYALSKWKVLGVAVIIGAILGFTAYSLSEKQYKVDATFFLDQPTNVGGNGLLGYAKVFGIESPANLESQIFAIFKSHRIKKEVASQFETIFQEDYISTVTDDRKRELSLNQFTIDQLMLSDLFLVSKNKNNLFSIAFYNPDRELAKQVILTYIEKLNDIVEVLELTPNKNLIVMLDEPEVPQLGKIAKPKKIVNVILGCFFSVLMAACILLILDYRNDRLTFIVPVSTN